MPNINDVKTTWNNIVTTFTAFKMDVTDTASDADSKLMDLQVGGVSQLAVSKSGVVTTVDAKSLQYKTYDTVALLLASTEASRGTGAIWEAGGFRYIEVASGGDITNSAGTPVELDVSVGADGSLNVHAFGALGDNATDDTTAIQAAFDALYDLGGGTLVFPAGVYLVTSISRNWASSSNSFHIKGSGELATILKKTGATTTPILDLSCDSGVLETYNTISEISLLGNAKGHDGLQLSNWARFAMHQVRVSSCDVGFNNKGSLVFSGYDINLQGNNTGYKTRALNAKYANLTSFYGGAFSANTTYGADIGDGSGFYFNGVDLSANGTSANLSTGAVIIQSTVDDESGIAVGSFDGCWFEVNMGQTFKVNDAELSLSLNKCTFLGDESGNAVDVGDIRSLSVRDTLIPTAGGTIIVAAKNFTAVGGNLNVITDNSTQSSVQLGVATQTGGTGDRAGAFLNRVGASTSYVVSPGVLDRQYSAVGNVGTGEDDLMSYTLPANALSAAGKGVRITAWGTTANNADTKTIKLYFDGTQVATLALTTSQVGAWRIDGEVIFRTAGLATCIFNITEGGAATQTDTIATTATGIVETGAVVMKVTGEATSNSDILQRGMVVEFIN